MMVITRSHCLQQTSILLFCLHELMQLMELIELHPISLAHPFSPLLNYLQQVSYIRPFFFLEFYRAEKKRTFLLLLQRADYGDITYLQQDHYYDFSLPALSIGP